MKRFSTCALAFLLILSLFAGCSASADKATSPEQKNSAYYTAEAKSDDMAYDTPEESEKLLDDAADDSLYVDTSALENRKIILNASVEIETTAFDKATESLQKIVADLGGYISNADVYVYNSNYTLHSGRYTVRIPATRFNDFISQRAEIGNVQASSVWQNDVTSAYLDIETRLATLRTKQERLLELMKQAELMEDLISLENALSDTIYEIESLTGNLKHYDDQINYSTITLNITEVREITEPVTLPKTLGERIADRFSRAVKSLSDTGEDFLVFLLGASPQIILFLLILAIAVFIVLRYARNGAVRKERRRQRREKALAAWKKKKENLQPGKPEDKNDKTDE